MEYIKIEEGKVSGHFSGVKLPEGKEFRIVTNFNSYVGVAVEALDFTLGGCLKPLEELIALGFVKDNRGKYYHTETKEQITISNLDVDIPEKYTKLEPKQFDDWNGSEWVENSVLKKEYEDNVKIKKAQQYLNESDYKVIKAIEAGKGLDDLYPGETGKREESRGIIRVLR